MDHIPDQLKALAHETDRLASLYSYKLLDSEIEEDLDELNRLAATICETPISLIVLLDKNRQWFKSKYGWDVSETDRAFSFCHYTIAQERSTLEVENALNDPRFFKNPLVVEDPNIRFYCGTPLVNPEGFKLGALCVIDKVARRLQASQKEALVVLSKQVVTHFELHKNKILLENQKKDLEKEVVKYSQDLIEVNNELKTLIYKASHEIRGPIVTIIGLSKLGQEVAKQKDTQVYLQSVIETGHRLDETLRNLLTIMELKDKKLSLEMVDAQEIQNILQLIESSYLNSNVAFEMEIDPDIHIKTDKGLFELILKNLIDNSIKYHDPQKTNPYVKIKIEEDADCGRKINVEDNGEGIRGEVSGKIFDMFYRGNKRSTGSGLGLFITKKVVEKLGGEISFSSHPNLSTTFTVCLK